MVLFCIFSVTYLGEGRGERSSMMYVVKVRSRSFYGKNLIEQASSFSCREPLLSQSVEDLLDGAHGRKKSESVTISGLLGNIYGRYDERLSSDSCMQKIVYKEMMRRKLGDEWGSVA